MKFFSLFFLLNLLGCSAIEKNISQQLTNSYAAVHLSDTRLLEEKKACVQGKCLKYLFMKAKSYQKNVEISDEYQVSMMVKVEETEYPISYNAYHEYQSFGGHFQGAAFIFPGFGAAHSTMWLYGLWLSHSGFDVIILPSASQMTPFSFGLDIVSYANILAEEYKPVLTIAASLGYVAALEFTQQYRPHSIVALAPVLDTSSDKLAEYFLNTKLLPWYLNWLSHSQVKEQINRIAQETNTVQALHHHQLNAKNSLGSTLVLSSANDTILGNIQPRSCAVVVDHGHALISSVPFESSRHAIRRHFQAKDKRDHHCYPDF